MLQFYFTQTSALKNSRKVHASLDSAKLRDHVFQRRLFFFARIDLFAFKVWASSVTGNEKHTQELVKHYHKYSQTIGLSFSLTLTYSEVKNCFFGKEMHF